MRFEWDRSKAGINFRKHGVSFEEASSVFFDPLAVIGADPEHSADEERMIPFGVSSARRLFVVAHTGRGDAIRIISTRAATRREGSIYEEG